MFSGRIEIQLLSLPGSLSLEHLQPGLGVYNQMTKGCIQGSVCGPTFWNLILDELLEIELPSGCHIQAYVDDVILLVKGKDMKAVETAANTALTSIERWGSEVKLMFSPAKTQRINFTPGCKIAQLKMGRKPITIEPHIKLLGVIIDRNLNFMKYVKYIIQKVTEIFRNLCKFVLVFLSLTGTDDENITIVHVIQT